jgi:hypothetical protein
MRAKLDRFRAAVAALLGKPAPLPTIAFTPRQHHWPPDLSDDPMADQWDRDHAPAHGPTDKGKTDDK